MVLGLSPNECIGIRGMRIDGSLHLVQAHIGRLDLVVQTLEEAIDICLLASYFRALLVRVGAGFPGVSRG